MTLHHETEIVATGFDAARQMCLYTVERDGQRYTAEVPLADLEKLGPMPKATQARRDLVARAVEAVVRASA